ncbi:CBS domain-containing protein [Salinigranum halophilum]|uniref:CBS domain-containing protein n=1 Tax=Salinigranum halophilum TaxID=2565931 RepID=UPI0010A77305|nr:CBS domain-containing protein [Salinigranum halophilum]
MDIIDIVSDEYVEFTPDTRVSKLVGAFEDPALKAVVVRGDRFEGVVTRRQLATSRHPPEQKLESLVWHVPRLAPNEDVRHVAQLMIDSDSQVLPVFEGQHLRGVVTADDVIRAVQPFLEAATVGQACSRDLVSVDPETTFGDALHRFREHHITHLPVVEAEQAVGILSLYDVLDVTTRAADQPAGGDPSGTDAFGGDLSSSAGRARRGGFGAREGERSRVLDLPVRDLMVSPVRTIDPEATLETAVEEMFAVGGSALVVTEDDRAFGIVTKTDVLDALTWEAGGNRAVQVYGTDLLDDVSYDEVVSMVEGFDDRDHGMNVLDAKVHLHEHDEQLRGTPLLLARVRLHTDRGLYIATGEGYGAKHALNEARDALERQIRDRKTRGRSKKHPDEAYWEKRFGWLLEA